MQMTSNQYYLVVQINVNNESGNHGNGNSNDSNDIATVPMTSKHVYENFPLWMNELN